MILGLRRVSWSPRADGNARIHIHEVALVRPHEVHRDGATNARDLVHGVEVRVDVWVRDGLLAPIALESHLAVWRVAQAVFLRGRA